MKEGNAKSGLHHCDVPREWPRSQVTDTSEHARVGDTFPVQASSMRSLTMSQEACVPGLMNLTHQNMTHTLEQESEAQGQGAWQPRTYRVIDSLYAFRGES